MVDMFLLCACQMVPSEHTFHLCSDAVLDVDVKGEKRFVRF